jgi:hypothetical protein
VPDRRDGEHLPASPILGSLAELSFYFNFCCIPSGIAYFLLICVRCILNYALFAWWTESHGGCAEKNGVEQVFRGFSVVEHSIF